MTPGTRFKMLRVLLVLVISIGIAVLLVTLRPEAERRPIENTGRLVETIPASAASIRMPVEAFGTVEPRELVKLVAQVRGQITDMHPMFKEGAEFPPGETLLTIDPRSYALEVDRRRVQIQQAVAELAQLDQEKKNLAARTRIARSDMKLADADYRRLKTLSEENVASPAQRDQARQRYLSSQERLQTLENQRALTPISRKRLQANLEMARVMLKQAMLDLDRSAITSSFHGWVMTKNVEIGEHVTNGAVLGTVYRDGAFDVAIRIPIADAKWLEFRSESGGAIRADIRLVGHEKMTNWTGRVSRTKASIDKTTRTLPLVVEIDTPDRSGRSGSPGEVPKRLLPGMFVRVHLYGQQLENVFVLPRHVLRAGDVVYLATSGRLETREVEVVRRYRDRVIIGTGLDTGDQVIRTPLAGAVPGMKIRVAAAKQ